MIGSIQFKVCGLTSAEDAELADHCGADYLGFNLYPASPRSISLERYREMAWKLPDRPKVAISVEPTAEELSAQRAAGFDRFQIHFRADHPPGEIERWAERVGTKALWLAPKLPPGSEIASAWLALAETLLFDTFQAEGFGGSGRTGDWDQFSRLRRAHPGHGWILAGGLNPGNVAAAIRQSGADWIDVNSGVEVSPGVKDPAKLKALVSALNGLRAP